MEMQKCICAWTCCRCTHYITALWFLQVGGGCEDDIGFSQDHTVVAAAAADLTMRPPSGLSQDHSCFKGLSMTCNTMGEQSYFLQENMVALPHKVCQSPGYWLVYSLVNCSSGVWEQLVSV